MSPKLLIVFASTRPGRNGEPVATWFTEQARAHGGFDVTYVDLADLALPLFDETEHPRLGRYANGHTLRWQAVVEPADAVVFVTPEYNWSFPASLKNALDYLSAEWRNKPVGFVSYGGVSAGTRAVTAIRPVTEAVGMHAVNSAVNVPFFTSFIEDGRFAPNDMLLGSAKTMLDDLAVLAKALAPLRGAALADG
jgi:NAD(P)H-dependent FMN reductase